MNGKSTFYFEGQDLVGTISGDLAGSNISIVFKDSNEVVLDKAVLNSPVSARLAGLAMIHDDLNLSMRGMKRFLELVGGGANAILPDDTLILEALWTSSVILYCKPFVDAKGRSVVLKFNQVFKGKLLEFLEEHNRLMTLRHEHLAHCGAVGLQQQRVFLLKKPELGWETSTIQTWGINSLLPSPKWVERALVLVTRVLDRVREIREIAERKLAEECKLGEKVELKNLIVEVQVTK